MCGGINAALTQASPCKRFHNGSTHSVCHLLSPVVCKAPLVGAQAKRSPYPSPALDVVYLPFQSHCAHNDVSEGKAEAGLSLEAPSAPGQAPWLALWPALPSSSVDCSPARFDGCLLNYLPLANLLPKPPSRSLGEVPAPCTLPWLKRRPPSGRA